jgi:5-deoxy-D-glucuronate isomerase
MLDQNSKYIKIEDPTLDLEVMKLKQHILEVTIIKEETQKLPKHKFDLTIVKEETQLEQVEDQKSNVQVGRFAIDYFYNQS